jgi:hypothetical protein
MTMSNQDSNHNNPDAGTVDQTIRGGYWMSLAEVEAGSPTSVSSDEFHPDGDGNVVDPMSRRNFFHLMGASMALAGVAGAGCKRYEKDEIVPLARRPEEQIRRGSAFTTGDVL